MARVLMITLDGYDAALGERFAGEGLMPALARLRDRSFRCALEHGSARRTGLAGEHFSTGLSPAAAARFSAVGFDGASYGVRQEGTRLAPFPAALSARTVVFNPTYFELARAPAVRGLVGWGSVHDPGAVPSARPDGLRAEVDDRFGADPGAAWTYGLVWPSAERTRQMARALTESLHLETRIALWLLQERFPDWDLAILGMGQVHSMLEAMWHGIDPAHPLHGMPSAVPAGEGVRAIYETLDRLIGRLADAFPDAALVLASMHGMGPNGSDLPGMLLLPELLCRAETGLGRLAPWPDWMPPPEPEPALPDDGDWSGALRRVFDEQRRPVPRRRGAWAAAARRWLWRRHEHAGGESVAAGDAMIDWMPAAWYRPDWPTMRAFALPAFYDGRIRINLAGRERRGRVRRGDYRAACGRIEDLLRACRDVRTGASVVGGIERAATPDIGPTCADIVVRWNGSPAGFDHPALGRIGPYPYRRTGGHTGGHGVAYVAGPGVAAGDGGLRSAFDVVPTVIDLLGAAKPERISGMSLLGAARRQAELSTGHAAADFRLGRPERSALE